MIIFGDVASPTSKHSQMLESIFINNPSVFKGKQIICNLEGLVVRTKPDRADTPILYNDGSVVRVLADANVVGVGLANNHTLDLYDNFNETTSLLFQNNIKHSGAGRSKIGAELPFTVVEGGKEVIVFNYCWDFLLYHQKNPSGDIFIAELDEINLIQQIKRTKEEQPDAEIIVFLHWSFDLEILPFPMYRQLAKLLIEGGATIIAGCHSHCVQGGERHADGYIVYGLGNFFIPNGIYAGGKLNFPEISKMQLAFEFDFVTREAKCHWFEYDDTHPDLVKFVKSEDFNSSRLLKDYSPYEAFSEEDYFLYFKKHRRKKLLIPIFTDLYDVKQNQISSKWLKLRANFLRLLSKYHIRGWQN